MNKDYSSQRYVDLDQITPANVGELKEVCEIQLNEPVVFSSGLLKVETNALRHHLARNLRLRRGDV